MVGEMHRRPQIHWLCVGCAFALSLAVSCTSVPTAGHPDESVPRALTGEPIDPLDGEPGTLVLVAFVGPECPIANACAPYLADDARTASGLGVECFIVYPFHDLSMATLRDHARDFGLAPTFVAVSDPGRRIVRALGATVTPEAILARRLGGGQVEILYRGRVNDLYSAIGRRRPQPIHHDLRDAVVAVAAGQAASKPWPPAIGCIIEQAD